MLRGKIKTNMLRVVLFLITAPFLAVMAGSVSAAVIGLRPVGLDPSAIIGPNEIRILPSAEFTVELFFEDMKAPPPIVTPGRSLVGYTLGVEWDPLIDLRGVGSGDWQIVDSKPVSADLPVAGLDMPERLQLTGFDFAGIADDNIMATLLLYCSGAGKSVLTPEGWFDQEINFSMDNGVFVNEQFIDYQSLTVHQVPIPASVLLLGSCLACLLSFRRKIFKK
jgi:hypothetical protein